MTNPSDGSAITRALLSFGGARRLELSRREFLVSLGAALSPTAWARAIQMEPTVSVEADGPDHQVLTVKLGDYYTWKLSTKSFAPSSRRPKLTRDPTDGFPATITLANARIPGTNIPFNFQATISNPGNGWQIDIVLNYAVSDESRQGSEPPLLLEWLSGQKVFKFSNAVPTTIHVGERQINSSNSHQPADVKLRCVPLGSTDGDSAKNLVLQPVLTGSLRLYLWFPGDPLQPDNGSQIQFGHATIDLSRASEASEEGIKVLFHRASPEQALQYFGTKTGFDKARPFAFFHFHDLKIPKEGFGLAEINTRETATQPEIAHRLRWIPRPEFGLFEMVAFDSARDQKEALVRLESRAALKILGPGTSSQGSLLHFHQSYVLGLASRFHELAVFHGTLETVDAKACPPEKPDLTTLDADHTAYRVEGRASQEARLECRRPMHTASIPIRLWQAHMPTSGDGASVAIVDFKGREAEIIIGERPGGPPAGPIGSATSTYSPVIHFGRGCAFMSSLNDAQLTVKRSCDLFDMMFEFQSYWIESSHGVTRLDRQVPPDLLLSLKTPTLVAVFPPQHVQERVFTTTPKSELKQLKPPDELAETLISGRTRIAMQGIGDAKHPDRQVFELTVENLTDWHDLALAVHRRALPRNAKIDEQLLAVNLNRQDSRDEARTKWQHSMLKFGDCEPSQFITQIEAVSGLIVSPDASAQFDVPGRLSCDPKLAGEKRTPLWRARLNLQPLLRDGKKAESCVRVIHARGTELGFIAGVDCKNEKDFTPFATTLTARDRSELLVLTSGFALPSLRRLQRDKNEEGFIDDPKGMVIRPAGAEGFTFLSRDTVPYTIKPGMAKPVEVAQEGLLIPRPFSEFELKLSSLKACLRSVWEGEPPAPYVPKAGSTTVQFYKEALNVQGYTHRTAYGRDAFVQVAYKGFLFPHGHRAALIKVTERQFRPARDNKFGIEPTAYLIKRNMIVCKKPIKSFPALGQPFAGREFPTSSVELVTVVTPDIIDPDEENNKKQLLKLVEVAVEGKKTGFCGERKLPGRVFWPRTAPGDKEQTTTTTAGDKVTNLYGNEVQFQYLVEGPKKAITSSLIFVDNTAAHHPLTMQKLVEYYNGLPTQQLREIADKVTGLRTATHGNVTRRYAPAAQSGDTSFDTDRWTLAASGAKGAETGPGATGNETFTMDALMEGADQPPFYPRLNRAFIKMQSLDRLIGRPQGLIETRFNRLYVHHALDAASNPSEIFLDVIQPAIDLNVTSQGQSAGALAQPNARLAAISRKSGMVGGQTRPKSPPKLLDKRTDAEKAAEAGSSFCDFAAAEAGQFDPAEFLGGGLGDAKLLGIVPLKDVVRVVSIALGPQLREVEDFSQDILKEADPIAQILADALRKAREAANEAVKKVFLPSSLDPLAELYPDLAHRLDALEAVLKEFHAAKETSEKTRLIGRLVSAVKELLHAIEATAQNPLPAGLQDYIVKIRELLKDFSELSTASGLKAYVQRKLKDLFEKLLEEIEKNEIRPALEAIFGTVSIADILRRPLEALDDLPRTVYFEAFARPLLEALTQLSQLINVAVGYISWSRVRLEREIAVVLSDGNIDLVQRLGGGRSRALRAGDPALGDLINNLQELAKENLADLLSKGSVSDAVKTLYDKVQVEIDSWVKNKLPALLQSVVDRIKVKLEEFECKLKAAGETAVEAATSILREEAAKEILTLSAKIAGLRRELEALAKVVGARIELPELNRTPLENELQEIGCILAQVEKAIQALFTSAPAEGERLRKKIEDAIRAEITDSVQRLFSEITALTRNSMEDVMARLLSGVRGLVGIVRTFSAFVALAKDPKDTLNKLQKAFTTPLRVSLAELEQLETITANIRIPIAGIEAARSEFIERVALLRGLATRTQESASALKDTIDKFSDDVGKLPNSANDVKKSLDAVLQGVRRLLDILQEFDLAAADTLQFVTKLKPVAGAAGDDLARAREKLKELLDRIYKNVRAFVTQEAYVFLKAVVGDLEIIHKDLTKKVDASFGNAKELMELLNPGNHRLDAQPDSTQINLAFKAVIEFVEERQRLVLGGITTGLAAITDDLRKKLLGGLKKICNPLGKLVDPLAELHGTVESGFSKVKGLLTGKDPVAELIAAIARPGLDSLDRALTVVHRDKDLLQKIQATLQKIHDTDPPENSEFIDLLNDIKRLVDAWTEEPGLVEAVRIVSRLVQSLVKGQLGALVDFSGLRRLLEDKLLDLLPTRFRQTYDWDTTLDNFPKSGSIFLMDHSVQALQAHEKEFDDVRQKYHLKKKNDLVLAAHVEVDLRTGARQASAVGLIAPFQIRLLGDTFDLITIGFKGASFDADIDGHTNCRVRIGEVKIGKQLEFIEKLQSLFNPGGNGPYVTLSLVPPAVEAGYRYSQPFISMGAMSLLNLGLSVSALLPFDQQPAKFRFSFASREYPFLISIFPYGGGGFVGLIASARGVIGFEIQFEFGAVVAISFGPLHAHGRVTAGIYFMTQEGEWALEGFVHAIGAGQIACFGIAVNIEIRVRQESGGAMAGSATFSFEISIGLFSISFSVTASHRIEGKKSGSITQERMAALTDKAKSRKSPPQTEVRTPRRHRNWRAYRRHLALS